jgi:hypothetical protein
MTTPETDIQKVLAHASRAASSNQTYSWYLTLHGAAFPADVPPIGNDAYGALRTALATARKSLDSAAFQLRRELIQQMQAAMLGCDVTRWPGWPGYDRFIDAAMIVLDRRGLLK